MVKTVFIAEKPSVALALSQALSNGNFSTSKTSSTPIHSFTLHYNGKSLNCQSSSVTGHLYNRDFPPSFNNRSNVNPIDLYSAPTVLVPTNTKLLSHLTNLCKNAQILYLALDNDAEGEKICMDVQNLVSKTLPSSCSLLRLRFSSLLRSDLLSALNKASTTDVLLAKSVDARQEIDLKVGVSFTRYQTDFLKGKFNFDSNTISYGPVQTPTLGFVVAQEDLIKKFVPERYYEIEFSTSGLNFRCSRGAIYDEQLAHVIRSLIIHNANGNYQIKNVIKKKESRTRPLALNTVEFLKKCSQCGISPDSAMHLAEDLYLESCITYPRTESTAYQSNFEFKRILNEVTSHSVLGKFAQSLANQSRLQPRKGKDVGDHLPISPLRLPSRNRSAQHLKVFDIVLCHFLRCLSEDAELSVVKISISIGDELFETSTRKFEKLGFLAIKSSSVENEDQEETTSNFTQNFVKGEVVSLQPSNISIISGQTVSPSFLTESALIDLMERHHIGTDASIASHLTNIVNRGYVTVDGPHRKYVPTELGRLLYHAYLKIDPDLCQANVRGEIQRSVELIAAGKAVFDVVLEYSLLNFKRKFEYFSANIQIMVDLFSSKFDTVAASAKPVSRCGNCSRYLKLITTNPPRLYCAYCEENFSIPFLQKSREYDVSSVENMMCSVDSFGLCVSNSSGRKLLFCPRCSQAKNFTVQCVFCCFEDCPHRIRKFSFGECKEGCGGHLFFEYSNKISLYCGKCDFKLNCPAIAKYELKDQKCDCQSKLIDVWFKKGFTLPVKFRDAGYSITEINTLCLWCDPLLLSLSHTSSKQPTPVHHRGRGSRGGRGRGGRGRGRGNSRGRGGGRGRGRKTDDRLSSAQQAYVYKGHDAFFQI
ncbi:hypothetical protein P9112_014724 [Eukaryota sp. TZLM1-RC]